MAVADFIRRSMAWALVVLLVAVAATAHAQLSNGDAEAQISDLRKRVDALGARDDVESAVRERVRNTYQQAIASLEAARNARQRTRELREEAGEAPSRIRELKAELAGIEAPPPIDELRALSGGTLASRVDTTSSRLADSQSSLADLRDQLTRLAQRPEAARQELADARTALQALDTASADDTGQSSLLLEAQRTQNLARREALTAEIEKLQQELGSQDPRQRELEARRALAEARLAHDTELLAALQRALGERQNETAIELRSASQAKLSELRTAVEPIASTAQRNVELANQLTDVTRESEALATRQVRERKRVEDIQRRLNLVQRQLEIGGSSVALGDVLRAQRRDLAKPRLFETRSESSAEEPEIASAELMRFQLQQQRVELEDISRRVGDIRDAAEQTLEPGQIDSLRALLEQRRDILDLLIDAEGRFIEIGRDLRGLSQQHEETVDSFNRLLDERLFWLPSFNPMQLDWFARTGQDLPWAFEPQSWEKAFLSVVEGARTRPIVTSAVLLFIAALLGVRRPLRHRLRQLAEPVGNVRRDTAWLTLRAALITVLLFIPIVAVLLLAGYLARAPGDAGVFTQAVSQVFVQLAILALFLEPFAQVCRKFGLAHSHFLWSDEARHGLHRMLRWLLAMLVIPTILVTFTEAFDDDAKRETIGRGAFMFGSLVIAVFSWRLLHPVRGELAGVINAEDESHWRLGYLWLPIAVGVPLLLFGLAGWGYYYTALQLQSRFFYSAGLLGGCFVLYALIVRWLTVAERRLALTRALRKREEAREARATRDAAAAAGESTPENLDTLEIDLMQISEQTRGLIKVVIALITVAVLWIIWSDTLPALQLLDNVTLWQYATEIDGKSQLTRVTLGALLLALALGVVTALAGRNLPGFLEITVLRRFSMDAGSRYAMATLFQYAIVIIGLLGAVALIGFRWSSIQWLVAAVGVGLGFGLQEIFANFVSGIVILFERPVRVGDTVTVGTLTGTVSRIRIRATTVTDWDNKEVVIPNKTFITETVINWTLTDDITRLIIRVHLALDTDTELAEKLIMDVIRDEPVALDNPAPTVFFVGYDDSALIYEARIFYHDLYNLLPLQHAIYKRMHAAFRANDVVVSFPQQDLHLRSIDESFGEVLGAKRNARGAQDDGGDGSSTPSPAR
ncbi:mechanosensitive ion channel domain-containing protein [Endozoicomonas sp. G2_2]|uniref:mechanosensitive ion channel domain-containing protein n=1 Tax=Endozoicomonas sp. G2_2 TaxID=2821092 RepID=UPI001AD9BA4A|nr:mechanosensitive ion channel domain-containing protein [Endozoicomonas sp. G2_2]